MLARRFPGRRSLIEPLKVAKNFHTSVTEVCNNFSANSQTHARLEPMTMNLTAHLSVISIFTLVYTAYQRFSSRLSSISGPFSTVVSKLWLIKHTKKGDFHRQVIRLHNTYGPMIRIAPNEVFIVDPLAIKKIYGMLQGGRKFDLFGEQDIAVHASQRRLVSRIYAMETLKDLEPYLDSTIQRFMAKIKQMLDSNKQLMLTWENDYYCLPLVKPSIDRSSTQFVNAHRCYWRSALFSALWFLDAQEDDGIFSRIHKSVASGVWLDHVRWILTVHNFLMPVFGNHIAINDREGFVRDYTIRQVNSRMERGSERPDILGKLFAVHKEKPSTLTMANITSVCSSNVGAGSDTISISLRAIIWFLLSQSREKGKVAQGNRRYSRGVRNYRCFRLPTVNENAISAGRTL